MSHIGKYKLKLENITKHELDLAIKLLLQNGLIEQTNKVVDYYGNERDVPEDVIKVKTKSGILGERGIGVRVSHGQLELFCDTYMCMNEFTEFKSLLEDAVTTIRLTLQLKKARYSVKPRYSVKRKAFVIVGVQY